MSFEEVLHLLLIVEKSQDHPQLKGIRDKVLAELAAVEPERLYHASQADGGSNE